MNKIIALCLMLLVTLAPRAHAQNEPERDPFRFGDTPDKNSAGELDKEPAVTLILINGDRKIAIIGGRRYRVGEKFEGGIITAITLHTVTARATGVTRVYYLQKGSRQ